ncbi:MAG: STAS domain-containing protein [Flavobacteriaceae bacterium]|nr:STAS domain-containing protein [Flavobacteriaceae bacterium]
MVKITIANDLRSEYEGYDFLVGLMQTSKEVKGQEILVDLSNVSFIDANLCALIGAIFELLESNSNELRIVNINPKVETILRKNEFLLRFGFDKIADNYNTALMYWKFTPKDDISFSAYIQNQLLNKPGFPSHSVKLGKAITRNIFEIYENARTHGQCDFIHTCGQFFPRNPDKPLQFTIVDKGINIKENVSKYLKREVPADEAIEWAMVKGNTTKTGTTSGGLGLAVIFDFIKLNKGKIQVISSDGFYEFKNGIVLMKKLNYVFDGTIVNIKFNLNDANHYILQEEVDDNFENIF